MEQSEQYKQSNYADLRPDQQWEVDKRLGLLDFNNDESVAIESSIDDIQSIVKRLDQRHGEDAVKTVLDGIAGWWELDVVGNRRRDEEMNNQVGN